MKKFLFIFFVTLMPSLATAADIKIGFVNMNVLLKEAPQVQEINKKLQDRFSVPKKELDTLGESIQKQEKEIKRNELLMTESKLEKSKQDLVEQIREYREKEAKLGKELQAMQNQELAVFRDIVRDVIKDIATEEKYDLIVNDGVMFATDEVNITEKLLARLKKQAESR